MPRTGKNNERKEQLPRGNKKTINVEPLNKQPKQLEELRLRAEEIVKGRIAKPGKKAEDDTSRLIHDLEVHQIELEMQNEELHRTYKELEDSRNKYSNLYDLAPVGYFTFDKNACVVEANLTGCQMLGMERAFLIKKPFHLYISGDCQDLFYLHRGKVFETDTRQSCEISLVTKDGKKLEVLLESVRAANTDGDLSLFHTTVTDITELNLAEKVQNLAKFPSENPYPILRIHKDGTVLYANKASESFLKAKDTAVGRPAPAEWRRLAKNALSSGQVIREENTLNDRVFSLRAVPIAENNYVNFYGTDITERKRAEEDLRKSEDLYRVTFENTGTATVLIDEDTTIILANTKFEELSGFSKQEVEGKKKWTEFVVKEDLARMLEQHRLRRENKEAALKQYEFRFITRSGEIRNVAHFTDVIPGTKRSVAALMDVTEQKKAEETLRESEAKYRAVIETTDTGFVALDEKGHVLNANLNYAQMIGYFSVDKIIGRQVMEWTAPYDLERNRIEVSKCFNNGSVRNLQIDYRRADGTIVPVEINANVVQTKNGKMILTLCRNITERKQAEEALRESETRFRELFKNMSSGVAVYEAVDDGKDFNIKDFNGAAEKIEKVSKKDILSKRVTQVFPGVKEMGLLDVFRRVWKTGRAERHPTALYKDDHITSWRENYVYKLPCGDFVAVYEDVTERKQTEQKILDYQKRLKQLASRLTLIEEQERRQIAGEIHDEISQTLAMAKIKLDALRSSPPSEWSPAEIKQISSSIEKVIQETRTLTFELSNPILYELGFEAAAAEWLNEQVRVKRSIDTDFFDDGKAKPLNDDLKVMLFRNVRELLTNCIKHAKAEKISVSIHRIDDSIQVTVEDDGAGFDPARLRTTAGKKITFGLFSIRESMENTGGSFEIESKPGTGCKAVMTAPLKSSVKNKEM